MCSIINAIQINLSDGDVLTNTHTTSTRTHTQSRHQFRAHTQSYLTCQTNTHHHHPPLLCTQLLRPRRPPLVRARPSTSAIRGTKRVHIRTTVSTTNPLHNPRGAEIFRTVRAESVHAPRIMRVCKTPHKQIMYARMFYVSLV